MGLFQITIWTTHLNNGILVSANETACNWILRKIYNTHWHSDRNLSGIDYAHWHSDRILSGIR